MLPMLPAASAGNLMNQYRNFIVFQTISLLRHVDRLTDSTAERLLPGAQQQIHLLLAFLVFLDDCGFKDCVCTVASSTPSLVPAAATAFPGRDPIDSIGTIGTPVAIGEPAVVVGGPANTKDSVATSETKAPAAPGATGVLVGVPIQWEAIEVLTGVATTEGDCEVWVMVVVGMAAGAWGCNGTVGIGMARGCEDPCIGIG
mmetsp:Transcript_54506/g.119330  ORF Transcript_54506/g.119330 Transcript_54506/m.119330 type:complete len:201 (-) Transcript_54506:373-975(-)